MTIVHTTGLVRVLSWVAETECRLSIFGLVSIISFESTPPDAPSCPGSGRVVGMGGPVGYELSEKLGTWQCSERVVGHFAPEIELELELDVGVIDEDEGPPSSGRVV